MDANPPVHISLLSVSKSVNEIIGMKLITKVGRVGMTWLSTGRPDGHNEEGH